MAYLLFSVVLMIFTIFVNEILKKASRLGGTGGRNIYCKVCGRSMWQAPIHWAYRLPFEIWAVVAKYDLKPAAVQRYVCPDKHTQAWFLPSGGDRSCDVLVSKTYPKG